MPALTFDRFEGGLDVRPDFAISKANILRVLTNAYVTTGRKIKKRPCLRVIATLEAGTVGLKASGTKLRTFYGAAATITHANTLFQATRVPHYTTGAAPTKIEYCDQFNALPYVVAGYADGTFRHHYLDDPGAWVTATAYAVGVFRRPVAANGFRYEVTAIAGTGTSGGAEPVWPTTIGATVVDNAGANQITWTCRTFAITDVNCPHTKQVTKRQQKVYAAGAAPNGANVNYCKTGDCRDWTAASDAGFLPAGLQATGSDQVTAIGQFQSSLVVFFSDSAQVWAVSADPAANELTATVENVGTSYSRAAHALAGDLFFLSQSGYRSMSLLAITQNLQDSDVGNPVDDLVLATLATSDDPLSLYYPKLGQWWSIIGSTIWTYSFSKTAKLSAWSKFTFPFAIVDATVLNGELYVRSGDIVYQVDKTIFKDGASSIPLVDVQMYYQDANKPDVLKQFTGQKHICKGTPTVSYLFDAANQTLESAAYELPAVTEPGTIQPVELCATRIAPHYQHQKDEDFELSMASLLYENLGAVG